MSIDVDALRPRLQAAVGDALRIGDVLGVGGFAAVFRARDPFLERDVAIKVLDPSLAITGDIEAQFLDEARIVAGVEHPHIVPLYDAQSRDGLLYLVMRLLPGRSLADQLRERGALPPAEAVRLALQVAQALEIAHERGIVHRDIKPDNILLDASGNATVTDFGISRVTARPREHEQGMSIGTPHYMSPEQALGEDTDGRSDVYALGVVLFEMLTGRPPFEAKSSAELMAKVIASPAPSVKTLSPDTPAPLVSLVERMLSKPHDERPTASETVALLRAAATPDALRSPKQVKAALWRRRALLTGIGCIPALVVFVVVFRGIIAVVMFLFTNGGDEPVVSAFDANVPTKLVSDARASGGLQPTDSVIFAFIPAGETSANALLVTTTGTIVKLAPSGAKRIPLRDHDFNFNVQNGGVLVTVASKASKHVDTIYTTLHGRDMLSLMTATGALSKRVKTLGPTDSTR